jgi:hypothetical protein
MNDQAYFAVVCLLVSVIVLIKGKLQSPWWLLFLAAFLLGAIATRVEFRLIGYDSTADREKLSTGLSCVAGAVVGLVLLLPGVACWAFSARFALPSVGTATGIVIFGLPSIGSSTLWASIVVPIVLIAVLTVSYWVQGNRPWFSWASLVLLYASFSYIFTAATRYLSLGLDSPELVVGDQFISVEWIALALPLFVIRLAVFCRLHCSSQSPYEKLGDANA